MNFRDLLLDKIQSDKQKDLETLLESERSLEALEKAYFLVHQYTKTRFERELKQYNNNEERALNKYVAKKTLDFLGIYIEEGLLLDKSESEMDFYKEVRREMRRILHALFFELNKTEEPVLNG